jgi:hypothetical protein
MGELTVYRHVSVFDRRVAVCVKQKAAVSEWRYMRDSAKKTLRELYVGSIFRKTK